MRILGNRIYLEMPELPETKLHISPETKKEIQEEMVGKFDRMRVYAVNKSEQDAKPGDEVFVDPNGLRKGVVFKIDGKELISVSSYDIMHVW